MSKQFRGIRPEDMTKLQQIIAMMSRGSVTYARRIADSIDEPVAHEVAQVLVGADRNAPREYREFAEELKTTTTRLARKVAFA